VTILMFAFAVMFCSLVPRLSVMAGLVPAIHVLVSVDARAKPGHDKFRGDRRQGLDP
jgi:hypothetical protein